MKSFILITAAVVFSGSILTANADSQSDVPTAIVKFADLDANRTAGKEELYRRLTRAAIGVCSPLDASELVAAKLQLSSLHKACIDQAVIGAVAKINRPDFTEYAASRMNKPAHVGMQLAAR